MRALIAIALACCLGVAGAASQPPAPSAYKASAPQQSHASEPDGKRGAKAGEAKQAPLVVLNVDASPVAKSSGGEQTSKGNEESPWKGVWDAMMALSTLALAGITGVLVYFTRGILVAAEEQFPHFKENVQAAKDAATAATATVATMQQNAAKELRAYVGVSRALFRRQSQGFLIAEVDILNCGKTPAKIVRLELHYRIENLPCDTASEEQKGGVLMPGLVWRLAQAQPVRANVATAITEGAATAVVWGRIDYLDEFGGENWTTFRFVNGMKTGDDWQVEARDSDGWRNDAT
jgi:hypothetical protein